MRALFFAIVAVAACGKDHPFADAGTHDAEHFDGGSLSSPGIYVTNSNSTITVFALDATGDVAPLRTIGGASTMLSLPIGIAVDRSDNLYVANRTGSTITVYPTTASGDVAPSRVLTGTGMLSPEGLAVTSTDELFVTACPSCGTSAGGDTALYHFAAGAITPDRVVKGTTTGLTNPGTLAVTLAGEPLVGNAFGGLVETFAPTADGDVAPAHSFTPSVSNLQSIAHGATTIALTSPGRLIDFYDLAATGNPSPAGSLPASQMLPLQYPGGIYIDTSVTPERIYLADFSANAVYVIDTAGTEPNLTVASVRTISGASTALSAPLCIAVIH